MTMTKSGSARPAPMYNVKDKWARGVVNRSENRRSQNQALSLGNVAQSMTVFEEKMAWKLGRLI